jgi:spermidine synthase
MSKRPSRGRSRPGIERRRSRNVGSQWARWPLYTLFFLSGVSGLIYETVWLRILTRVVGNTIYATSIVLAAFMAGMAVGSYVIGRYASGVKNQLRLYAFLEFGVGLTAVGLTAVLLRLTPFYQVVYDAIHGNRVSLTVVQSSMAFALMLVPASLMGGTLPVLSSYTKNFSIDFAPRIGFLYGLNTLGALLGVISSGFVLIGAWGETATFLMGAGLTLAVAALALTMARRVPPARTVPVSAGVSSPAADAISPYPVAVRHLVGWGYALSGLAAMSYEIVWTRMFQIQVGTSIYSFSIMLAFYLAGIGLGSLVGGRLLGGLRFPLAALGLAQLGIALYGVFGLYICTLFDPVSLDLRLTQTNVLVMPPLVIFPITLILGAMFPLVSRCYVANEDDVSRAVGRLYSLNTLGCIVGSLLCGFLFIGLFGTRGTILLLAALNVAIGLLFVFWESASHQRTRIFTASAGCVAATVVLALLSPDPFRVAVSKALTDGGVGARDVQVYYNKESATATTTAVGIDNRLDTKRLLVNGIGMSNLCIETKLVAHLPLLLHPDPKDVLVICFGMGTTVRSVRVHKAVECDAVELVPEVFECFPYFHDNAAEVLADPRIHCYADDGRNFLLLRTKRYDVINVDPAPPIWSAGTVNLYTKEFFELCKDRLKDQGIMCLWVPPVQGSEVLLVMKTFHSVFPNARVWRAPRSPVAGFYMMGYCDPKGPAQDGFRKPANEPAILADLNEWKFEPRVPSLESLKGLLLMSPEQLGELVADVPVITDDHPYTEFPLWRSLYDPLFNRSVVLPH